MNQGSREAEGPNVLSYFWDAAVHVDEAEFLVEDGLFLDVVVG